MVGPSRVKTRFAGRVDPDHRDLATDCTFLRLTDATPISSAKITSQH